MSSPRSVVLGQALDEMLDELLRLSRSLAHGASEALEPLVDRLTTPFDEAVRVQDENGPDGQLERLLPVLRVDSRAERQAATAFQELDATVRERCQRRRVSGGRVAADSGVRVDDDVRHGGERGLRSPRRAD